MQRLRDAAEGIDSAGFVSGYRGSRWAASTWSCGARASTWKPPG